MQSQIEADLAPFRQQGITLEVLERSHAFYRRLLPETLFFRFRIVDHEILVPRGQPCKGERCRIWLQALQRLSRRFRLPDLDFLICLDDSFDALECPGPVFAMAKDAKQGQTILIPDIEALQVGERERLTYQIVEANKRYSWETKREIAFWRGAPTGGMFTCNTWLHYPRSRLVLLSQGHPEEIDARFTVCSAQVLGEARRLLSRALPLATPVSPADHLRYKYLIDMDGNTCTYARCYWILLSNSVMFKQVSDQMQWYYGALKPWKHYIPFTNDLLEKIAWARAHDDECRRISDAATKLVLTALQADQNDQYLFQLLSAYSVLQRFVPRREPAFVPAVPPSKILVGLKRAAKKLVGR